MNHRRRSSQRHDGGRWRVGAALALGALAAAALAILLVGVPWGLITVIGWPLPDHLPSVDELRAVAFAPMSPYFFLNVLACACWLAWAGFAIDVGLCLGAAARRRVPPQSARHTLRIPAAALVNLVVIALIVLRNLGAGPGLVVTDVAPAVHTVSAPLVPAPAGRSMIDSALDIGDHQRQPPTSVLVRGPHNGVHDSLWRISKRTLGEGHRWPEIFDLNKGMRQPNGQTFLRPSLIYPGQELRLPTTASPRIPTTDPNPPGPTSAPSPVPAERPSVGDTPTLPPLTFEPGLRPAAPTADHLGPAAPALPWFDTAIVGAALAVAFSAALITVRRRARRRYRPGSGDRVTFPAGPVVRRLRLDHLEAPDPEEADDECAAPSAVVVDESNAVNTSLDGAQEIAMTLAAVRGLGLVGDGAAAAVRALLLAALLAPPSRVTSVSAAARALVPIESLPAVLGDDLDPGHLPPSIEVVASLDDALDALELETLNRIDHDGNRGGSTGEPRQGWPLLVLVTEVPDEHSRLQTVLDNGAQVGILGLMLGQWRPGVSAYVRTDGTVSASSPGLGGNLRGARLFQLEQTDTVALLDLLHQLAPEPVDAQAIDVVDLEIADPEIADPEIADPDIVAPSLPGAADSPQPEEQDPAAATAVSADRPGSLHPIPAHVAVPADASVTMANPGPRQHNEAAHRPIAIRVFGPPRVLLRTRSPAGGDDNTTADVAEDDITEDITTQLQPRTRELLVYLALHPAGVTREALAGALYPSGPLSDTGNALNSALTRLRRAIDHATRGAVRDLVVTRDGLVHLDDTIVATDFTAFHNALAARRAAQTDADRTHADQLIVNSYHGSLADGMTAEWIETARDGIRRTALDAAAHLARTVVQSDPQRTLDLLETARTLDPHNEPLYRDIMRVQARTGRLDAVSRTLALLTTRLAEVGETPTPDTAALAARLISERGHAAS